MERTAVIYTRVSTEDQAEHGYSLRNQKERLDKYARANKTTIIKHFQDDYSAKTLNRPEFNKMRIFLKENHKKIDSLIFTKWDRLARNTLDTYIMVEELQKLDIDVICLDQPVNFDVPENQVMFAVFAATPQVENARRALNTKEGMRRAQKEGRWVASAPKGYENQNINGKKTIEPNADAHFVKKAFIKVAKSNEPINSIRLNLKKEGFYCSNSQFYSMLRNPVYMGKIHIKAWKKEEAQLVSGQHMALISESIFYSVQKKLNGINRDRYIRKQNSDQLYLRGNLLCPSCGKKLTGSASTNRNKNKYHYYHCQGGCKTRFRAKIANDRLETLISNLRATPEAIKLYQEILIDHFNAKQKEQKIERSTLEDQIAEQKMLIEKADDKFMNGDLDVETHKRITNRYSKNKALLISQKSSIDENSVNFKINVIDGLNVLQSLPDIFRNADRDMKLKILGSIFNEKVVFDGTDYRTPKFNAVLDLLFSNSNGYGELSTKKADKTVSFSDMVAPTGLSAYSKTSNFQHFVFCDYGQNPLFLIKSFKKVLRKTYFKDNRC